MHVQAAVNAWSSPPDEVLAVVRSRREGLSRAEVGVRLASRPRLRRSRPDVGRIVVAQFLNPLVLLLLAAAAISFPVGNAQDGLVILGIIAMSGGLGFYQEYRAADSVARLLGLVRATATVRRQGAAVEVSVEQVVPGDVVLLAAGATVPGDARILAANGLQVDESALTGESFPSEKGPDPVPVDAPLARRSSLVYQGTHVVSGTAEVVVVAAAGDTELGQIRHHLERRRAPSEFELGLQAFGTLLVRVSAILVIAIFAVNVALDRPALDAFLFSVALAVGLVPELLPAIVTLNLSQGAARMGTAGVIVKRLSAIEDLGSVDILCSDKTGTLTEGRVRFAGAFGADGQPSDRVLELGWVNATFESGYANPIDAALRDARPVVPSAWVRAGEVPYDFTRRRLTVLVDRDGTRTAVMKGQLRSVLGTCVRGLGPDGRLVPIADLAATIGEVQDRLAESGLRTLGVAWRDLAPGTLPTVAVEEDMVFAGILAFSDPPKADAAGVLDSLESLGVAVVVITGDDRRCAAHVWRELRGRDPVVVGADELHALGTEALERRAPRVQVFAEVEPIQKERIVRALRSAGHVVAYLGDGINDAPALRASDVGISVEGAADVAREAADVVLRQSDLGVLATGIKDGRRTLANSLKYVYFTTSANFGNMLSMAVASAFLPFLPLLPKQILLNNFLSDLPAMAIAGDHVDREQIARPGRWQTTDIRRFMIVFGSVSSAFDLLTFGVLIWLTGGAAGLFRTGWFVESLLTEVLVLFVMRSPLPLGRSLPGRALTVVTLVVAAVALLLPYTSFGEPFGLEPLPPAVLGTVAAITLLYVAATELTKRWFFARS